MKKKLLCMALAILMLCTVFLTSCSDGRTDDEIIEDIVENSKRDPYVITIMVPTDGNASSVEFKERLAAVQEEINVILRQDCTEIKLIAVNDSEYDQYVRSQMNSSASKISQGTTLPATVPGVKEAYKKYVNGVDGDYTIQLKYPDIMDAQIDIILVRNYDDYVHYTENEQLISWSEDLDTTTGVYRRLNSIIKSDILDQFKIGSSGKIFAIPNNHNFSNGMYHYMLINKDVASSVSGFDIKKITNDNGTINYDKLGEFVAAASTKNGVLPFVADESDVPNLLYWGNNGGFSVIGSTADASAPADIFSNPDYVGFTSLYKQYNVADDGTSKKAVTFYTGTNIGAELLEDDYYIIKTNKPVIEKEAIFESAFAVTKYSRNYERAKEILFTLMTDADIRTLLQYGVKGTDYKIVDGVLEMIRDNNGNYAYEMDSMYTGNGYITYPADGIPMEVWDYVKNANYDAVINPYSGFEAYYNDAVNKAEIDGYTQALNVLNDIVKQEIGAASADEFAEFITEWKNADTTNENVLRIKDSDAYKNAIAAYTQLYVDFNA